MRRLLLPIMLTLGMTTGVAAATLNPPTPPELPPCPPEYVCFTVEEAGELHLDQIKLENELALLKAKKDPWISLGATCGPSIAFKVEESHVDLEGDLVACTVGLTFKLF